MTKHTILFLAANPRGTDQGGLDPQGRGRRGALDQEASAIRKELKRSGYRDRFELVTRWAAEPLDLLRELRELKPTVVHFSGQGGRGGLWFQAPGGDARAVSSAAIAETFGAAGGSVKLVVLSACYSEPSAEALLAHVDCVVGMTGVLHDDMARAFAIGFYGALGDQESVAAAYQHGNAAISLEGLADVDRPQLKVRAGADAARIVLAAVAPAVHVALPCPYPGMRPYSADDADHFHGRGALIDELIGRLRAGEREIYVIGPSGSGKSSLVAAGVLPRLARGVAGLGPFAVRSMRPGEHPAARLGELLEVVDRRPTAPVDAIAALLVGRAASASVLILVDQLEELFTLADASDRAQFLLAIAALRAVPRCAVVFTLRADFFGAFMECPLWTDRHGRISRIEVGPLRGEALREAIVCPVGGLGVRIEPELIERLLADAGSEPGVLPLLQETLVQLWERRQGQTLTLTDYHALGDGDRSGLAVALSRRADALLRDLTPAQEAIARRILLRLISFGEGRSDTRRQQPLSRLRAADDDAADFDLVLRRLIDGRLLTADDDDLGGEARLDLAHEAMIAAWPTLAGWIQTHRANEQRRRQLEAVAAHWVAHGRGARGLLDPIDLAEAEAWQQTESARELGESADVAALVRASQAAHDHARRRRRRLVWTAFAVLWGFAAVVTTLATVISVARTQESELERDALRTNAIWAHNVSGTVALHLREQIDTVVATAADPRVARLVSGRDDAALELLRIHTRFDSISIFDRSGIMLARAPRARPGQIGSDYSWRDYFIGAGELGSAGQRAGYISSAFLSEGDGTWKFAVAAPLYVGDIWTGVVMATTGTDSSLGKLHLHDEGNADRTIVVVAPQDRSRADPAIAGRYVVILHDMLPHGAGISIDSPRLQELRITSTRSNRSNQLSWIDPVLITDDTHRDPLPGFEGRWLAGFAPVGKTGFVVIVQTRNDTAIAPNARLSRRLVVRVSAVILSLSVLFSAGLWGYARRKRRV